MAAAQFRVSFAGPLVSVQDAGRFGMLRYGVPASGPMDRTALATANRLLGKNAGAAAIEVSLGGLVLDCMAGAVTVAVIGGGFIVEVDGVKRGSWTVIALQAGQRLTLRKGPWGSWTYLAFAGVLTLPDWLGSHSTHALSGLGGGMLRTGQVFAVQDVRTGAARSGPVPCPVWARPRHDPRVVIGPQDRYFSADKRAAFLGGPFFLTDACDRMGVRLKGPDIAPTEALSIPSSALLRGSVQVAGDGVASVLLADHQTTGGYPKIAVIVSGDVDGFAQLRPQDAVRFHAVSADDAVQITRARLRASSAYLARLPQAPT